MNRNRPSISQTGRDTQPRVPTTKMPASIRMLWRRPYLSESRPPISAPMAAPKIRMLTTKPSVKAVRPRSALHRHECAVDDAGVVAEEQTAEGRDDGDQAQPLWSAVPAVFGGQTTDAPRLLAPCVMRSSWGLPRLSLARHLQHHVSDEHTCNE